MKEEQKKKTETFEGGFLLFLKCELMSLNDTLTIVTFMLSDRESLELKSAKVMDGINVNESTVLCHMVGNIEKQPKRQ